MCAKTANTLAWRTRQLIYPATRPDGDSRDSNARFNNIFCNFWKHTSGPRPHPC